MFPIVFPKIVKSQATKLQLKKSAKKFSLDILTKLQPLYQTVVNMFLISSNINKFSVGIFVYQSHISQVWNWVTDKAMYWLDLDLINICYFKMKFVMCGISSHSSWWQQEFSGWHNPLDCYDKETFNISILCWTYHFYCRENLLTNEHLLFLLRLLIRVIFWQTDDIFHVACFQYWGRVDLSQKIVSKKTFTSPVSNICYQDQVPTVQKVG